MIIEISQETYDFAKNLVHEIETQDNRSTRYPILYVIREKVKEYGIAPGYGEDGHEWVKDSESYEWEDVVETIREIFQDNEREVTEDDAEDYGFCKVYYRYAYRYSDNFFFTEKAAQQHLHINGHNLTNPQDYVIHAFRNEEIESVIEVMKEIAKAEVSK